jgi:hypothetical protein
MEFTKTEETRITVVFQADSSQEKIYQRIHELTVDIKKSDKNDPLYVFKHPWKPFINYFSVRLKSDYIYFPRSGSSPSILVYFKRSQAGKTTLTFNVSYLPVHRIAFFISIPLAAYFAYQMISSDYSMKMVLVSIGFCLMIWLPVGTVAYFYEKSITKYFKRDVQLIINDLSNITVPDIPISLDPNSVWAKAGRYVAKLLKK